MNDPETTYNEVMKFLLKEPNTEGCPIRKYVELVCKESAPQVYSLKADEKKLKGVQHRDKFAQEELDYIYNYCKDMLEAFGYDKIFTENGPPTSSPEFIHKFNQTSLANSI
mmetsp:Transcript_7691/g.7116  ORF Transcript_7691/g.7116 Transcript_7691/m.7116 type:complete len:111 (+) Transcript_7691:470-802(+)